MSQLKISANEPNQMSQPKAEACGETLFGGIFEGVDDPEFRRFINQRNQERAIQRLARPPAWHDDPPTPKQLAYLKVLGHRGQITTKGEAAKAIEELVGPKKK